MQKRISSSSASAKWRNQKTTCSSFIVPGSILSLPISLYCNLCERFHGDRGLDLHFASSLLPVIRVRHLGGGLGWFDVFRRIFFYTRNVATKVGVSRRWE